jgi:hypothetical protein
MKFISMNELEIFEFHDAITTSASLIDHVFEMNLKYLNVHKMTTVNPGKYDLQIKNAALKFSDCTIDTFVPDQEWKLNENGVLSTKDLMLNYTGADAESNFIRNCEVGLTILSFECSETEGLYSVHMGAIGKEPYFEVKFRFRSCSAQWDEYSKKAWYEYMPQYQPNMNIRVSGVDQVIKAYVRLELVDDGVIEAPLRQQKAVIGFKPLEKEIFSEGKTIEEALNNLSLKLPKEIQILSLDKFTL